MKNRLVKRIFYISFLSGILMLSGCGTDPLSKQTMEEIDKIGKVELNDEESILDLEKTYSEMTDKQKNQVKNYVDLKNARRKLDELKKEEEAKKVQEEKERIEKEQKEREELASSEPYSLAIEVAKILKQGMYNPESLLIEGVIFCDKNGWQYVGIDFLGDNKMGGTIKSSFIAEFHDRELWDYKSSNDAGYEMMVDEMINEATLDRLQELDISIIEDYM